ncbi:MAG: cupin domain-containing protein [Methylococcaceae bacterium]|nr:cupin domain-containing protein [Methylococcaceae bacterium]
MKNRVNNLFADIPEPLSTEYFQTLLQNSHLTLERIISKGHFDNTGDWYDQDSDEWVILLAGQARLQFAKDDALIDLKAGDYLFIPAHEKHRVDWTDPTVESIWLALHINDINENSHA